MRLFVTCYVQRLRELSGAKITVVQVLENFPPFRSRLTKVWLQNKGVLVSETLRGKKPQQIHRAASRSVQTATSAQAVLSFARSV